VTRPGPLQNLAKLKALQARPRLGGEGSALGMLGANGTQISSKTIWKGEGKERIDVENPNPGKRLGQIHYQDVNNT
jgi:filamentous hemagglutinin